MLAREMYCFLQDWADTGGSPVNLIQERIFEHRTLGSTGF